MGGRKRQTLAAKLGGFWDVYEITVAPVDLYWVVPNLIKNLLTQSGKLSLKVAECGERNCRAFNVLEWYCIS